MNTVSTDCLLRIRGGQSIFILALLLPLPFTARADTHYVSMAGGNAAPYTNEATAANSIQAAVDAAVDGDTVQVAAGIFEGGINVSKNATVRGAGAGQTIVDGNDAVRCFSLGDNAIVAEMTIRRGNGLSAGGGGGVYGGTASNCILSANSSGGAGRQGGGALRCRLYNCLLIGNSSGGGPGGGACEGSLYNCTLSSNSSGGGPGSGAFVPGPGAIYNSIIYPDEAAGQQFSCWTGNPKFVGDGDYSLRPDSPCINAADASTATSRDILGYPRIVPDIGAFEFDTNRVIEIPTDTHYVSLTGGNIAPYTNEATAATSIQSAVDAAADDDLVLVAAGTFAGGISVGRDVTVRGAGAGKTVVDGNDSARCFSLAGKATVVGMTLTRGNSGGGQGGGVYGGTVSNCVLIGNSSAHGPGGGVYGATLYNCTLSGNSSVGGPGGGANESFLYNCLLTGNSSGGGPGGGACGGALYNCTLSGNSSGGGPGGGVAGSSIYNSIIYPDEAAGPQFSCWTADPKFVGGGDFSLRPDSPCINAADASTATSKDYLGNPRNTPDIGAFEFVSRQGDVLAGYVLSNQLEVVVQAVAPRTRSNLIDIDYIYTNSLPQAAEIRGVCCSAGGPVADASYSWIYSDTNIHPIVTLAEGTATNYGAGILPSASPRRLTWDAGADVGHSMQDIRIVLMATEVSVLPLSLHFVTVPASGANSSLTISRYAGVPAGGALNRALLFAICRGWVTNSGPDLYAVGGAFNGQRIFENAGTPTEQGKLWMCEKLGNGIRLATPAEVKRAQEGTTPGAVVKRPSYWWIGTNVIEVNQYDIETGVSNAWYFVKE